MRSELFKNKQLMALIKKKESELAECEDSIIPKLYETLILSGVKISCSAELPNYLETSKADLSEVLLDFFSQAKLENERIYILDCLTACNYKDMTNLLLKEYESPNYIKHRWELGDLLYRNRNKKYISEYIDISKNDSYGSARQMVILILGKLKVKEAIPVLIDLLDDPTVCGHALDALSKFNDTYLLEYFYKFRNSEFAWIRRIANNYIKKHTND